jgi:hypothetical protein
MPDPVIRRQPDTDDAYLADLAVLVGLEPVDTNDDEEGGGQGVTGPPEETS